MSELIDREAVREFIKSYRHSTDVVFDMEKHLDEIPAAPRWVRCEEAKPQNKTRCLLAIPTAVKSPDYKHYYEIGYYDGGHFTAYNSELGFIQLEPEWWMPIEPPKEEA